MELKHSRTKGSKNGIRLYQNKDGTWTELGKERRRKDAGLFSRKQKSDEKETSSKKETIKKIAKGTAITAGVVLAAYGAYKFNKLVNNDTARRATAAGEKAVKEFMGTKEAKLLLDRINFGNKSYEYHYENGNLQNAAAIIKDVVRAEDKLNHEIKLSKMSAIREVNSESYGKRAKYAASNYVNNAINSMRKRRK